MSDITISPPDVVTGHTDVICSTSIRHVVTVRKAALQQTETPVSYTHLDVYKRQSLAESLSLLKTSYKLPVNG